MHSWPSDLDFSLGFFFAKTLVQIQGEALLPQNHTARPPAPVFPSWRLSLTLEAESISVRGLTSEASSKAKKWSGQDLIPWQNPHALFPVAHTREIRLPVQPQVCWEGRSNSGM